MNHQEIRAAAAHAAATLMCTTPPPPADFIAVAEVIEAYIRDGKGAAFALCSVPAPLQEAPESVDTATAAPEGAAGRVTADIPALEPQSAPEGIGEVTPLAVRGAVSAKQEGARRIVEKTRQARVDSIMAQASVAKAQAHKQRLMDDVDESGLSDHPVIVKGKTTTLGTYIGSLLGS